MGMGIHTRDDFNAAFRAAEAGEEIVYRVGQTSVAAKHPSSAMAGAWAAYERGEAILVQRRRADGLFEYLAIRRRKPERMDW